jgi:low temperature requirement protein LtrA
VDARRGALPRLGESTGTGAHGHRRIEHGVTTDAGSGSQRVSTLELFFDLVFVLAITQLTDVLYRAPTLRSLFQVVLMLALIWWMYGGYAWLTNAVAADATNRRVVLLGGMGGFLLLSLAVPNAFSSTGLAFGLAYLVIVTIHTGLFTRASSERVVEAILRIFPLSRSARPASRSTRASRSSRCWGSR